MKKIAWIMCFIVVLSAATGVWATEGKRAVKVSNRIGLQYDDNVLYTDNNKDESFRISDQLSLTVDKELQGGFIGLRLESGYTWYDDRSESSEWRHKADLVYNQQLSRTIVLGLVEAFVYADRPELENEDGTIRRADSTYIYNTVNATLATTVSKTDRVDLSGRWQFLRYDETNLGEREDYDILAAGLSYSTLLGKESRVYADARYEQLDYTDAGKTVDVPNTLPGTEETSVTIPDRSASFVTVGLGGERLFSPNFMGKLRAGYMYKDYDAANSDSENQPYGEGSITVLASPQTSLTLGAGYSLYQSSVLTYANQARTTLSANVGHDLTAKIKLNLGASYVHSDYDAENSVDTVEEAQVEDGTEEALSVATRVSYRLNRTNYLEAGWQLTDFSSELTNRRDYQRNLYDISWKVSL